MGKIVQFPADYDVEESLVEEMVQGKFDDLKNAVKKRLVVVVDGNPGIGKTYAVREALTEIGLPVVPITGKCTPAKFYEILYRASSMTLEDGTPCPLPVMFDDAEGVLDNPIGLAFVKAALDTNPPRIVSYNTNWAGLPVPAKFEFKSKFIFITNEDMNGGSQHLQAVASRNHIKLWLTPREVLVRTRHIALNVGALKNALDNKGLTNKVWKFIEANWDNWNEQDARVIKRVADEVNDTPDWQKRCARIYVRNSYIAIYV
jgi:hypothetical protein